jgi:hypothetical protein
MSVCKYQNFSGVIPRTPVNRGREKGGGRKRGKDGKEKGRR